MVLVFAHLPNDSEGFGNDFTPRSENKKGAGMQRPDRPSWKGFRVCRMLARVKVLAATPMKHVK